MTVAATEGEDEAALAARACAGDRASFGALVESLAPSLVSFFAIRGLDPGSAEECVQETLVRAYRSLGTYSARGSPFRSWVYGIAANVFRQAARRRRRHEHEDVVETEAPAREGGSSGAAVEEEEQRQALRSALAALPDRMQLVLQLRFFEGRSCVEIAEVLGTTVAAVSPLIYRAKAALRERLERVESPRTEHHGGSHA